MSNLNIDALDDAIVALSKFIHEIENTKWSDKLHFDDLVIKFQEWDKLTYEEHLYAPQDELLGMEAVVYKDAVRSFQNFSLCKRRKKFQKLLHIHLRLRRCRIRDHGALKNIYDIL